jgi:hypothetical protein
MRFNNKLKRIKGIREEKTVKERRRKAASHTKVYLFLINYQTVNVIEKYI